MLEEFKSTYATHLWLRYVAWMGLVCVAIFILWVEGGFPPQAWFLLVQFSVQLPHLWDMRGSGVWLPLFALLALSLLWLLVWVVLVWGSLGLMRHHFRMKRYKLQAAVDYSADAWLPSSAVVSPDGMVFTHTLPRLLNLPQRAQDVSLRRQRSPLASGGHRSVQDIPTRPEGVSDTQTSVATVSNLAPLQPLAVGVGWDVGLMRRRNPNEDSVMVLQSMCTYQNQLVPLALFVVADGMGGHDCGLEASRIAIQSMMHTVLQTIVMGNELSDEFLTDMLVGGVEWANRAVCMHARQCGKEMGTTLTAAVIVGMKAYVVNVGDSRAYRYREGAGLEQITQDHSLVATLVALGEIKPEEVYSHPDRNKVYRSLGGDERVEVDAFVLELQSRDVLLLCSDGLWEMVRDPEILQILRRNSADPMRASEGLVHAALLGGGVDNVSVIVVKVP